MKFLCIECDEQMAFEDKQAPGDGTLAVVYRCPGCGRGMAMLNNPAEAQLVTSLGVAIGHEKVAPDPFGTMKAFLKDDTGKSPAGERLEWDEAARTRLQGVPSFVRGMVMKIYGNYAQERGIRVITPAVMDQARSDLGLEGM
jgi:hypothetical protein